MIKESMFSGIETEELLKLLAERFKSNMHRHPGMEWDAVETRLRENPGKILSLKRMEETGGEPDVLGLIQDHGGFVFYDCSLQSPRGRRNICYDRQALESRKQHKPADSALDMAVSMGIEILNEEQYRILQHFGGFDTTTSSWIQTPASIRKLGGAMFADFRYGKVFVYHNGAESYYASRGFRGLLRI
jgi:hypothetical protein